VDDRAVDALLAESKSSIRLQDAVSVLRDATDVPKISRYPGDGQSLVKDPRVEVARICGTTLAALWTSEQDQDPLDVASLSQYEPVVDFTLNHSKQLSFTTSGDGSHLIRKREMHCALTGTPPFRAPYGSHSPVVRHIPMFEVPCLHVEVCKLQEPPPPPEPATFAAQLQQELQHKLLDEIRLPKTVTPSTSSNLVLADGGDRPDGIRKHSRHIYVTPGKANRPAVPATLHQQSQLLLDAERGFKRLSDTLQTDTDPIVTKKKTEKHAGSSTVTTKGNTGDRTGLVPG
jgi:hypothetical protein